MSKGFLWFAQNNDTTDYVKCSIELAKSIKQHNKENAICVVTDENSKFENEHVDIVKVMNTDESAEHKIKWANEYNVLALNLHFCTVHDTSGWDRIPVWHMVRSADKAGLPLAIDPRKVCR